MENQDLRIAYFQYTLEGHRIQKKEPDMIHTVADSVYLGGKSER